MKDYITTSIFDIFKTGPGPSSSHTIGPMKAALGFREAVQTMDPPPDLSEATIDVYLYGSLSLTGESQAEILTGIDAVVAAMCQAMEKGLDTDGLLPGPIGLMRKAPVFFKNSARMKRETGRSLARLNAYDRCLQIR